MSATSAFFLKFAAAMSAFLVLIASFAVYADSPKNASTAVSFDEVDQIAEDISQEVKGDLYQAKSGKIQSQDPDSRKADDAYEKALAEQVRRDRILERQARGPEDVLKSKNKKVVNRKLPKKKIEPEVVLRPMVSQHPEYLPSEPGQKSTGLVTPATRVVIDSPQKRKKYYNVKMTKKASVAISTSLVKDE